MSVDSLSRPTAPGGPAAAPGPPVDHAVYEGTVRHRRFSPRRHEFEYAIAQPMVRLDRIDELLDRSRWWSRRRFRPVRFDRRDHLGDPGVRLDTAVRDLVENRGAPRPTGPITMLAHLRTFGWCFNPIAVFYCYDDAGTTVETQLLDVMNTPWGERHAYVIRPDGPERWQATFDKELHVSPFMGMHQQYRLSATAPGDELSLGLANIEDGRTVFDADLHLRRRPATPDRLRSLLWRYPLMTLKVSAAIHWQALRLAAKRVPFHAHPDTDRPERTEP